MLVGDDEDDNEDDADDCNDNGAAFEAKDCAIPNEDWNDDEDNEDIVDEQCSLLVLSIPFVR